MFDSLNNMCVVVAHPDDEVLGAGGTIAKFTKHGTVDLILVSDGSSSQYQDVERQHQRHLEFEGCCERLGINKVFCLGFPDMKLDTVPHIELNEAIQNVFNQKKYDCVLTHFSEDVNLDHHHVAKSVQVCTRPTPGQSIKLVAAFYVPSSTEWGIEAAAFTPDIYVDINNTLKTKLEALAFYEGELRDFPHPRSLEAIEITAKFWGSRVGLNTAEPFKLLRYVGTCPKQ